ncbi:YhdH/YhfP family quinone oxidoreductase [Fundicoccus culcitae]|uniref:YhdH/YhfP family quinone oxidoreductase n=1 Tax=Fundicoccus culcitae TaxID=2969821 RepID=A0ABY5P734_9LACT|nr:YhdH/YhfP family quinone oxidoreductase [Fundicoccus culcitae]UUX34295.1 YhdH/YhfP family quinone oxidoreductase [Fundicoccus culcitae]
METFKAIIVREVDDRIEFQLENTTLDDLSPGEVLIKVSYSSVNYKDMLAVQKNGGVIRKYPMIPGIDLSGIVVESQDERLSVGQKVIAMSDEIGVSHTGGYAEYARVNADSVIPLPDGFSLKDAELYGVAGYTAAASIEALESLGMSSADNPSILVTGSTGGVGSIAVQMLIKAGYTNVTALVRKDYQVDVAKELGAHHILQASELLSNNKPLNKRLYHYVIDTVGGEVAAQAMTYIHENGKMTLCGNAGGNDFPATVLPMILRGVHLIGISVVNAPLDEKIKIWGKIANEWNVSDLVHFQETNLENISETFDALHEGRHLGRTIVKISDTEDA